MNVLIKSTAAIALLAGWGLPAGDAYAAEPGLAGKRVFYVTRLDEVAGATERHRQLQQQGLAADRTVAAHLESMGLKVTFADQTVSPSKAAGFDLVVLSSVVQSHEMADTGFKDVAVPLLTWEDNLMDSLRLCKPSTLFSVTQEMRGLSRGGRGVDARCSDAAGLGRRWRAVRSWRRSGRRPLRPFAQGVCTRRSALPLVRRLLGGGAARRTSALS